MPLVRIENLKAGMHVAEDVFSKFGSVLVNAGERLDEHTLEKLKLHNIKYVKIIDESADNNLAEVVAKIAQSVNPEILENLTETYEKKADGLKNIFTRVNEKNEPLLEENLTNITDEVIKTVGDQKELFKYIARMKKTSPSIYTHSLNVSLLCDLFAKLLRFPDKKREELVLAGLLHDIGKTELGLDIGYNTLNIDNLSGEILEKYKKHSILSYRILSEKGLSKNICLGVLMHHETEQGTGFPTGAKWSQIHEFGKIIGIANYYDHLTFSGSTKKNINPFAVIKILEKVQYEKFDINFMTTFLKQLASYYQGEWVELTTGEIGQIVFINNNDLTRPIVKIGNALVDLSREKDIDIVGIL